MRGTKFGDVITAVASAVILVVIIGYVMNLAFSVSVSAATSDWASIVQAVVGLFISAAIVGYAFARRIWSENGLESIFKISVLGAIVELLYVANYPSLPSWGTVVDKAITNAYPNSTFSASQLLTLESNVLGNVVFENVVIALVVGFVGLYIGSKLRKPKKT